MSRRCCSSGELVLERFEDNENANTFYRRSGWLEVGKHFDMASGVDKIVFRKSLTRR